MDHPFPSDVSSGAPPWSPLEPSAQQPTPPAPGGFATVPSGGAATILSGGSAALLAAQDEASRARYFRCDRLGATLSLAQCRVNRAKLSYHEALRLGVDPFPPDIQPLACWSCCLALAVEAGGVPFYTRDEVARGRVPRADDPGSVCTSGGGPGG